MPIWLDSSPVEFDVARFEADLDSSIRGLREGDHSMSDSAERLAKVLDLYRGPYLAGEAAGDWHYEIRDRLASAYTEGLRRLVAHDTTHEVGTRLLMLALAKTGRRQDALRAFERLRVALSEELATVPDTATRQLAARIRNNDAL